MNKTRVLLLIFLIMALSFLAKGCSFHPKTSLMILHYYLEKAVVDGELTAEIKGAAVNDGSTRLEYAEVEGNFYSQDGTLLATGFAKTIKELVFLILDPGDVWDFTITYPSALGDVHSSLNILQWDLKKDSSAARIIVKAENNGDVMLSFAEITGTFYDAADEELDSATATTTRLGVGEVWEFSIYCPAPNFEDVDHVTVEVTEVDYELEPAQVDHATAEVGTLRGRTIMP